jgi:hypothetical protein
MSGGRNNLLGLQIGFCLVGTPSDDLVSEQANSTEQTTTEIRGSRVRRMDLLLFVL